MAESSGKTKRKALVIGNVCQTIILPFENKININVSLVQLSLDDILIF